MREEKAEKSDDNWKRWAAISAVGGGTMLLADQVVQYGEPSKHGINWKRAIIVGTVAAGVGMAGHHVWRWANEKKAQGQEKQADDYWQQLVGGDGEEEGRARG